MSVKFLTRVEAESWRLKNGIHVVGGEPKPHERSRIPAFKIPEDAGARTSLAKILYPPAEDGESLLILNLLFLWDCWVISSRGEYVVFFSHDECGELYVVPETRRSAVKDLLKGMRLFTN